MANYTSKYTGAQIDLAVASGSSVTGKIIDDLITKKETTLTDITPFLPERFRK